MAPACERSLGLRLRIRPVLTVACRGLVRVCLDETIVPMRAGCLDNLVLHMHATARPTEEHMQEKSYI